MISSQIPMRRFENGTRDPKMIAAMLDLFDSVHVGCFDEEYPYVVPMSYGYDIKDGKLLVYVHCAREGHKVDLWRKDPHVALTFSKFYNHPDRLYKGCMHDFRSVMALGTISLIDRAASPGLHGAAVQSILRHNARRCNQFSVPHYMFMAVYMITCEWENVVGKFENPIEDPSEVPFPDVYSLPLNTEPYDCAYFYHKKTGGPLPGVWRETLPDAPILAAGERLPLPPVPVELALEWRPGPRAGAMDCDLTALILDAAGKVRRRYDMAFYNQRSDRTGAVVHGGDDALSPRKGREALTVRLDSAPEDLAEVLVSLGVYQWEAGGPGLEDLADLRLTVTDPNGGILGRYALETADLSGPAAAILSLKKEADSWQLVKVHGLWESWRVLDHAQARGLTRWKE